MPAVQFLTYISCETTFHGRGISRPDGVSELVLADIKEHITQLLWMLKNNPTKLRE